MNHRAVIADDEPYILRGLRKLVDWSALGVDIVGEASDGDQLVRLLQDLKPDLLLSDICMPKKTGLEVLKLIALAQMPTKVIFFSGHKEFEFAREAVAYGAIDYLLKPIHTDALIRAVERALGQSSAPGPEPLVPVIEVVSPVDRQIARWRKTGSDARYVTLALGPEGSQPLEALMRFAILNLVKRLVPPGGMASAWEQDGLFLVALPAVEAPALKVRLAGSLLAELGQKTRVAEGPMITDPVDLGLSVEGALEALALQTFQGEGAGPPTQDAIQRVVDHMARHYAEPLSLEDAATVACMNPSYFSASFKRHTGKNFKDTLNEVRVEASLALLLRTDLKVYEVAQAVGFKDPKVFAEVFRRFHHQNPADYKNQILRNLP